nr:universal stress protein [Streptomyces sp. SM13]
MSAGPLLWAVEARASATYWLRSVRSPPCSTASARSPSSGCTRYGRWPCGYGRPVRDLTVTHHVETGTSVPGILVESSKHADLMVSGTRRHLLGLGPALGRVSHAVLHHGHCPIEIIPPEHTDTGKHT